jgi:hypothetical protein
LSLRRAREVFYRDINPTVYTTAEFRKKQAAKDHFLTRVLDRPKLFVIGNSDGLEKLLSDNRVTGQPHPRQQVDAQGVRPLLQGQSSEL